jgi:hypothetical protein
MLSRPSASLPVRHSRQPTTRCQQRRYVRIHHDFHVLCSKSCAIVTKMSCLLVQTLLHLSNLGSATPQMHVNVPGVSPIPMGHGLGSPLATAINTSSSPKDSPSSGGGFHRNTFAFSGIKQELSAAEVISCRRCLLCTTATPRRVKSIGAVDDQRRCAFNARISANLPVQRIF